MPWAIVACAVASVAAQAQRVSEPELPKPEPSDCASCGAPLSIYAVQCDYCKRVKESQMLNWFKRTPKETAVQARLRMAAEQRTRRVLSTHTPVATPASAPAPSSSFDPVSAALWYSAGSSSSHTPSPAPEPDRFSSGGGGNFGGGGASGSWESSSSCSASSSSDSSSYSSSSSDSGSSSSSCGSD